MSQPDLDYKSGKQQIVANIRQLGTSDFEYKRFSAFHLLKYNFSKTRNELFFKKYYNLTTIRQ